MLTARDAAECRCGRWLTASVRSRRLKRPTGYLNIFYDVAFSVGRVRARVQRIQLIFRTLGLSHLNRPRIVSWPA